MTSDLLPCPFCGGSAESRHRENDYMPDEWIIECVKCGAMIYAPAEDADNRDTAIAAWNTRAPSPDLAATLARAAEDVADLRVIAGEGEAAPPCPVCGSGDWSCGH